MGSWGGENVERGKGGGGVVGRGEWGIGDVFV